MSTFLDAYRRHFESLIANLGTKHSLIDMIRVHVDAKRWALFEIFIEKFSFFIEV